MSSGDDAEWEDHLSAVPAVGECPEGLTGLQDEEFVDEGDIEYPFEEVGGNGDENRIRGNWPSHMDYYMSVFGFTFALGNLWRFPNQCHVHGGIVYLVPYITMFLLSAIPVLFMELALGQFISLGPTSVWKVAPLFKGELVCARPSCLRNRDRDGVHLLGDRHLLPADHQLVADVRAQLAQVHAALGDVRQRVEHTR